MLAITEEVLNIIPLLHIKVMHYNYGKNLKLYH